MGNYIYNVGATDSRTRTSGVTWHREPQAFPGTAQEFAETVLRDLISADPRMAEEFITVKVWDNDREGPGDFSHVAAYALNNPEEPRRPDEITVDFFQYYVASADYEVADDAVLGGDGTEWSHGTRTGLVVPSDGPALLIRTGHQFGYIALEASWLDSEPEPDLAAWEAAEQVTVRPQGPVRVYTNEWVVQEQYPDLAGGRDPGYLTIRVSARGRDANRSARGRNAGRPREHHRIEAWAAPGPAPRLVLKRDQTSQYWEQAGTITPP